MALRRRATDDTSTPLDGVDVILADLDGVVYRGEHAIAHAVESLNAASRSARVGYLTNNASRTDTAVATHLSDLGLTVAPADVVTSPQAAMRLLARRVEPGATVLVVGGDGLVDELTKAGYGVTRSADDGPAAVVQGFSKDVGWRDLAEASFALGSDADMPWIATNTDWTLPVERGLAPGNGTLVSAVHSAVGRLPEVAGKPETPIFDAATERFAARHPLFIGDRLDTDILGANRAGMDSLMVLTGVDHAKQLIAVDRNSRPTFIVEDLRGLHEAYPKTVFSRDRRSATVRNATVRVAGNLVEIVKDGDSSIDLLRAACAAIWESGQAIYALDVPERLYT
ncbi:HAD-IIA family hydrolase [Microbacterium sp. STN6]|uniref:HAD-IIA family hydrolase n=1 Tax=Microbacterium sp. STN6 TaxID=2995588 RepID=UPI002260E7ED|nr:HAD-IIA family hydrolase [Microbacterium sp. STN6]MCX7521347.1 HAD-IIA family hydrolase [Microbacterium sp. STN6]